MEKQPESIEEAQHILERKGITRDIIYKSFFGIPAKIIKLQEKPKTYLIEINEDYLKGLTILTPNDFKPLKGASRTVAYLSKAYFLRNRIPENRKYPATSLKYLYLTKGVSEVESKKFTPVISKVINEKIREAIEKEDKQKIEIDIEEFQELSEELKSGLEEFTD